MDDTDLSLTACRTGGVDVTDFEKLRVVLKDFRRGASGPGTYPLNEQVGECWGDGGPSDFGEDGSIPSGEGKTRAAEDFCTRISHF